MARGIGAGDLLRSSFFPAETVTLFDLSRGAETTTSSTFATITNGTKEIYWPGGKMLIMATVSNYSAANTTAAGYRIIRGASTVVAGGGTGASLTWRIWSAVNEHNSATFFAVADVPQGTHTFALQWNREAGAGTVTTDGNDMAIVIATPVR